MEMAHVDDARGWGYDYVEIFASLLRPLEDEAGWRPRRRELQDMGANVTHLAGFILAEARFVGPDVDWGRTRDYLETCVGRAAEVGVRVFNWGSPMSKSVPFGFPYSKAFEQIERCAHMIADIVAKHDAICVIEPINPSECNVIYYVTDGAHLAASVNRSEIRSLADYFHMSLQNEPLDHLALAKDWIAHTHTSGPGRYFPMPGQSWDQSRFLRSLKQIGYDSTLSMESWTVRPGSSYGADAAASVSYVRQLHEQVTSEV